MADIITNEDNEQHKMQDLFVVVCRDKQDNIKTAIYNDFIAACQRQITWAFDAETAEQVKFVLQRYFNTEYLDAVVRHFKECGRDRIATDDFGKEVYIFMMPARKSFKTGDS
jgi:hypothetical protein